MVSFGFGWKRCLVRGTFFLSSGILILVSGFAGVDWFDTLAGLG